MVVWGPRALPPNFQKLLKPGSLWQGCILWKVAPRGNCIELWRGNLNSIEDSRTLEMPGLHPKEEAVCVTNDRSEGVGPRDPICARWCHPEPQETSDMRLQKSMFFLIGSILALDWPFLARSPFFPLEMGMFIVRCCTLKVCNLFFLLFYFIGPSS